MNTIATIVLIVSVFLLIRRYIKNKNTVKEAVKDTSTEDFLYPENFYSKDNYRYTGKVPKEFEDLIISFKIKGATSGSTEDGISIQNNLLYYKDKVVAFRDKNGRMYINIDKMEGYGEHISFCLARGYQSSEEYTYVRSGEKELLYLVNKEIKGTDDEYFKKPKEISLKLPEGNMELEYLDLIKNREVGDLFGGNASNIPEEKRAEVKKLYAQWIIDGWLYKTEGKESALYTFTKNDFTKILKENNLPISGNKADLVDRIIDNLGFDKFYELGEIRDSVRLSDIGKSKIKEYRADFKEQYISFRQEVQNLFEANQIVDACYNVTRYNETYPFNYDGLGFLYCGKDLYSLCALLKESDVFEKIGIPKEHHEIMINTMCMYFSFLDFDYIEKLEEIYNGFEELLIKSEVVKNKDTPFMDFRNYINDFKHLKRSKIKI